MIETKEMEQELQDIIQEWKMKEGNLIMILHQVQNRYGYIPREAALAVSRLMDVPLARIYEVITFYHYFKLKPPGKHTIAVCMGTACYLNGAPAIVNELENILGISAGETTRDGLFHVEMVRCIGCCGLAPVMTVDGKVFSGVKKKDIGDIVSEYSQRSDEQTTKV